METMNAYHNIIIELIKSMSLVCISRINLVLRLEIRAYAILESTIMFSCFDGKNNIMSQIIRENGDTFAQRDAIDFFKN